MSDKKTVISDKMLEAKLKEKSGILGITVDELINRHIRREIYLDDFYVPRKLTREELTEISKRDIEKDKKRGIFPKKHNSDFFVGLNNKYD